MARPSSSSHRPFSGGAKLLGFLSAGVLSWQVLMISSVAAEGEAADNTTKVVAAPRSPRAAIVAAERRLADNDPHGAKAFARQALSLSPISAPAIRDLALADEGLGDARSASLLLSDAAALGWRDAPTQLWLARAYLAGGDNPHAAERIDAALRTNPASKALFDLIDQALADPHFADALAARMGYSPDWRAGYLQYTASVSPPVLLQKARLLELIARGPTAPSREEVLPIVNALVQSGEIEHARNVWFFTQRASGLLFDPEFRRLTSTAVSPFEWKKYSVLGVSILRNPVMDGGEFTVSTDGTANGVILRQLIVLSEGVHTINYDGGILTSAHSAFSWRVSCNNGAKNIVNYAVGMPLKVHQFSIPPNCQSQYIELSVTGKATAAGAPVTFRWLRLE